MLISSVAWYPFDTGMFITGGVDKLVRVWDTETYRFATHMPHAHPLPAHSLARYATHISTEFDFELQGRVHGVAMSPVAGQHSLIAGS